MEWVIKSKHVNESGGVVGLELEDKDGTFDANIKWDGAMDIHIRSTTEENNTLVDTIHTNDIDGLISTLAGLKAVCGDYFGDQEPPK